MGEQKNAQQKNTQEPDLNQLRKVRREKLADLQAERKGSISDHKIRADTSQPGDQRSF